MLEQFCLFCILTITHLCVFILLLHWFLCRLLGAGTNGWLVLLAAAAPRPHLVLPPVGLGLRVGSSSREPLSPPLRRWNEPRSHRQFPSKATPQILSLRRLIFRFLNISPTTPCKHSTRQRIEESRQIYFEAKTQPKLLHPTSFKASINEGDC